MSKKRMNLYIIYFFIIFYLGTLGVIYGISRNATIHTFEYEGQSVKEHISRLLMENDLDEELSLQDIVQSYASTYGVSKHPYDYQLFISDEKSNILAKNGSCLEVIGYLDDFQKEGLDSYFLLKEADQYRATKDDSYITYIDIKSNLSEELKKVTRDSEKVKKYGLSNVITVEKLDYRVEDGKLIPVTIWIQGDTYENHDLPVLKFKLDQGKADHTYDRKENGLAIYLDLDKEDLNFNVSESCEASGKYYEKFVETSQDFMNAIALAMEETKEGRDYGEYSTAVDDDFFTTIWTIKYRGKDYALIYKSRMNPRYQTMHSTYFRTSLYSETFLVGLLLILALVATNLLYKKNQQLQDARTAFTSATAHELKTPLAIIQNQCECIMENVDPEKNPEYISSIYGETRRMNQLVLSFLQYNRLSQMDHIQVAEVNLSDLLREEMTKYETIFESMDVDVDLSIEDGVIVKAEKELLSIAIDNYLSNAAKYSTDDEANVSINLYTDAKGFHFEVSNPCDREAFPDTKEIWSILTKGDASRKRDNGSSGMGLPTTAKILELHKFRYGYELQQDDIVKFYIEGK